MVSGSLSHELLVCLGRLESHLTNCPQFMVGETLSLADVVTWAALYVLLSPEGSTPSGEVDTRHAFHSIPYSGKLSRIGERSDFRGEDFRGLLAFAAPKNATPPNLAYKTCEWLQNSEIHKSFLLRKFPTVR